MTEWLCSTCGNEITTQHGRSRLRRRGYGYCSYTCGSTAKAKEAQDDSAMRFMRRVRMVGDDECWTFDGRLSTKGYATFDWKAPWESRSRGHPASRMMWLILNGRIPPDKEVCHSCDNPACCNPGHLWLGTHKENMVDMSRKGRGGKSKLEGEAHPGAKLTNGKVRQIRGSGRPAAELALEYGMTPEAIRNVLKRKTWRHV